MLVTTNNFQNTAIAANRLAGRNSRHCRYDLLIPGSLIALCLIAAGPGSQTASAADMNVCVICNAPDKVYQCTYQTPPGTELNLNQKGLHFACIKEIAQYGEHGQCAAVRNQQTACNGEPYALKNTASLYKPAPEGEAPAGDVIENEGEEEGGIAETEPPQKNKQPTLVDETAKTYESAKETVKQGLKKTQDTVSDGYDKTSKGVKSVGDSISDAASDTYECLKSWFSNC